jgi:hypothetical protein
MTASVFTVEEPFTLKMNASCFFETLAFLYQTTQRQFPKDSHHDMIETYFQEKVNSIIDL